MTFSPRPIIASRTRACPSSPPEIRRSTVESPLALTSSTPGKVARASRSCGVAERRNVAWLSDGQALLHPFRELLDPMVRPIRELDFFEDRFAAVVKILRRHAAEPAGIGEGFQGRQVAVEFRRLDDRTDSSEGAGRLPPHIDAEEGSPTAGRPDEVGHDLDGRGL